jgi:hypothetical protein
MAIEIILIKCINYFWIRSKIPILLGRGNTPPLYPTRKGLVGKGKFFLFMFSTIRLFLMVQLLTLGKTAKSTKIILVSSTISKMETVYKY